MELFLSVTRAPLQGNVGTRQRKHGQNSSKIIHILRRGGGKVAAFRGGVRETLRSHGCWLEKGPLKTRLTSMTHQSQAYFVFFCEEGLHLSVHFCPGESLTLFRTFLSVCKKVKDFARLFLPRSC